MPDVAYNINAPAPPWFSSRRCTLIAIWFGISATLVTCPPRGLGSTFRSATSVTFAQAKRSPSDSGQAATIPPSLTVESNLILIPVFVYDPARMAQAPKDELPCARADVTAFLKIPATQPYLPNDCDVTEVRGLTVKD